MSWRFDGAGGGGGGWEFSPFSLFNKDFHLKLNFFRTGVVRSIHCLFDRSIIAPNACGQTEQFCSADVEKYDGQFNCRRLGLN